MTLHYRMSRRGWLVAQCGNERNPVGSANMYPEPPVADKQAFLEEYRALRDEIGRKQRGRFVILGFALSGVGTIVGVALPAQGLQAEVLSYRSLWLLCFAIGFLAVAQVLTIRETQGIQRIADYIRAFLEPHSDGLNYETRWHRLRSKKDASASRGCRFGMARALSLTYGLLCAAILLIGYAAGLYSEPLTVLPVGTLGAFSLFLSVDLWVRWSSGWKVRWRA